MQRNWAGRRVYWTIDQDNGVLVNAVREGLGYEIESEVIDMEPFYFEGINVEKDEEQSDSDDAQKVNHAPKAAIELLVVGGSTVQLSGAGSSDEDNDELSFSWGVPSQITVADKTAEIIEVVVPEVSEKQPSSSPCLYATATTNRPLNSALF